MPALTRYSCPPDPILPHSDQPACTSSSDAYLDPDKTNTLDNFENDEKFTLASNSQASSVAANDDATDDDGLFMFKDLGKFKSDHPKNMIIGHYNINSIRHKFHEMKYILLEQYVQFFGVAETKIDFTFPDGQFYIKNYKLYRQDRNAHGGGVMVYINDNIPHRILKDFSGSIGGIDFLTFELIIKSRKWYISYIYRPPSVKDTVLCDVLRSQCESFVSDNNLYVAIGDLNMNCFTDTTLTDFCEIYDIHNLIKDPTCFKGETPSLLDVVLTNRPKCFANVFNADLGLSDFHNCIGVASKVFAPSHRKRKIIYRRMKNFSQHEFVDDVNQCPFHVADIFDDVEDSVWSKEKLFTSTLENHAPSKMRTVNNKQVPYMNSDLRKAINQRNMWRGKHFRCRSNKLFRLNYVKLRNRVVKLRHASIRKYFMTRCNDQAGSKTFFSTMKPFLSKHTAACNDKIILKENDTIISEPSDVANIFNLYYASIADYKNDYDGLDKLDYDSALQKHSAHTSLTLIKSAKLSAEPFHFKIVTAEIFEKYIQKLNAKKAVGHDGIPAFFLKVSGENFINSLCTLFNSCISSCTFPCSLKMAEINPIFKKKDNLNKENYRSVNILTTISKVFERILSDQLTEYFKSILNSNLSAYRSGYSCQHVILQLTEYWRKSLDSDESVGTIATDLSKAFDYMPHGLLLAKLNAYGVSRDACRLLICYLCNRKQRVRVHGDSSEWSTINRGVPQGSVLGPLLFNIFLNDLFYCDIDSAICNYADDNHLCNSRKSIDDLKVAIEKDAFQAFTWFKSNNMDANPDKFQLIAMNRKGSIDLSISILGNTICSSDSMKVLGVTLDTKLSFDKHVSDICGKASAQISVLKRLSRYLNETSRIQIYKSFISSNFTYCPAAWIFCGKKNSNKLEKLQERALRFVFSDLDSSYNDLLLRGNFLSLSALRLKFMAIEVYKSANGLNPIYLNNLFEVNNTGYGLRDSNRFKQHKFETKKFGYRSFRYYGSKLWNSIPNDIKSSKSLYAFKSKITEWCRSAKVEQFIVV